MLSRKDILINLCVDDVKKSESWKSIDRRILQLYFDKMYTEKELEKMLSDENIDYDKAIEIYNNTIKDTQELGKLMLSDKLMLSEELISFENIKSMFPIDEEIQGIAEKAMKEYKEEIDSNDK